MSFLQLGSLDDKTEKWINSSSADTVVSFWPMSKQKEGNYILLMTPNLSTIAGNYLYTIAFVTKPLSLKFICNFLDAGIDRNYRNG